MSSHWGEMPLDNNESFIPDVSGDIERSMNKLFLSEFENDEEFPQVVEQIELPPMDPLMLHAIALHKYTNYLLDKRQANDDNLDEKKFPIMPNLGANIKHKRNCLNYIPQEFSDFTLGRDIEVPELSASIVRQILIKCIATMFAHIGYETSDQSALDVMTDVLEEFFKKITYQFKLAQEEEEKHRTSGFPNIVERVLTETGLGGVKGINDYYQNRVLKYITVLENRCSEISKNLVQSQIPSPVDKISKVVRVKVEEEEAPEAESTEVLFSTIDGDVNYSILETGYQLLNSFEANLQSLGEGEEDATNSQSPGVVSLSSESDLSHLSPFNKKKRYK